MAYAKILVVEDEIEMMRSTTKCLRSGGHDVIPATDGITATKLAVVEQPDLILLDIGLPAGDGHTVAERLRTNVKTMSIPVVYLTSHKTKKHVEKAKEVGAAGYIVKPYLPEILLGKVNEVLHKHRSETKSVPA